MITRALPLLAALWVGPTLSALAAEPTSPATPSRGSAEPSMATTLQAHHWTLQSAIDGEGRSIDALLPPGHPFVLSFDGARLAIRGGCNQMNGSWRLGPPGQMTIGRMAGTMKACEAVLMQADAALSEALTQPMTVQLTSGPATSLRLTTPAQQILTFSGQPTMRSLYGAPKRIFLEVAAQTVECASPSGATGRCLQVRELSFDEKGLRKGRPGPWQPFAGPIEGFTHTPGVRNVLRIDRYQRKTAPADGSAFVYALDLVVESEAVVSK